MDCSLNAFESLVDLFCRDKGSWRLFSDLCGNEAFLIGLELVGVDKFSCAGSIEAAADNTDFNIGLESQFQQSKYLALVMTAANLNNFSNLPITDWLGYSQLALHRFEKLEVQRLSLPYIFFDNRKYWQQISTSWAMQFLFMLGEVTDESLAALLGKCAHGEECLGWQDFVQIEHALVAKNIAGA